MSFHGIRFAEPTDGSRPIRERSSAIIGLVATAAAGSGGADRTRLDAMFPVDRPILVTDVRGAIRSAGSEGTLAPALATIAEQGSPIVVVVRVTPGADAAGTATKVIGGATAGKYTGMQALLAAQTELGVRPRILGAPGLDTLAVAQAFGGVAKQLRGFGYVQARGASTVAAAVAYRAGLSARELMLIWPETTGWDGAAVATALGTRAMIDEKIGWHKSISNVAIAGVTGLSRDVDFDLLDSSNDAGLLNEGDVTTLVRMNGFRFWGNRTCSDEPLFAFEPAVRTAQALQDILAEVEQPFIDRPLTTGLAKDLIELGQAALDREINRGRLVGGKVWFDPSLNPGATLAAGALTIDLDFTPAAPLEGLTNNLRITSRYYDGFGDALGA